MNVEGVPQRLPNHLGLRACTKWHASQRHERMDRVTRRKKCQEGGSEEGHSCKSTSISNTAHTCKEIQEHVLTHLGHCLSGGERTTRIDNSIRQRPFPSDCLRIKFYHEFPSNLQTCASCRVLHNVQHYFFQKFCQCNARLISTESGPVSTSSTFSIGVCPIELSNQE